MEEKLVQNKDFVSIPYRLATNDTIEITFTNLVVSFNSLQVGYKQKSRDRGRCERCIVSIPYRLATNLVLNGKYAVERKFQFLIGWLQTQLSLCNGMAFTLVSIPYRLATNEFPSKTSTRGESAFQFLIGWLQTSAAVSFFSSFAQFQFLIGWLQTPTSPICSTNGSASFNSLQVGYKPDKDRKGVYNHLGFNSLQVGYKQKGEVFETTPERGFNSLQVGYKRKIFFCYTQTISLQFQFLIGWLQTLPSGTAVLKSRQFQFLIGWLQTFIEKAPLLMAGRSFNSLQVGYKPKQALHTSK